MMQPEKVFSMVTEKSIAINDIPGGGFPDFTPEDARHALGHMKECEFNYCQYVFLLYDEEEILCKLVENCVLYLIKERPHLVKHDRTDEKPRGLLFVIDLCTAAVEEQRKPEGAISNEKRYKNLKLTRHEWRYTWKDEFAIVQNYLNNLRNNVNWHIYNVTKS